MGHLGIDRFHLVATAFGGYAALDYALSFPQKLKSLVVADSLGGVVDKDFQELGRRLRPPAFDALPPEIRELGPSYRAANRQGTERWIELGRLSGPSVPSESRQPMRNKITFSLLETIKVPTLLLTGGADLYAPPPVLKLFATKIANSQSVIVPEAGHSVYWENSELFNKVVLHFIGKH
jgi:pimeloyl-ACP methyl ester carboxylesterase